jgi:D-alanyl-D-alanine carboxypeptidase
VSARLVGWLWCGFLTFGPLLAQTAPDRTEPPGDAAFRDAVQAAATASPTALLPHIDAALRAGACPTRVATETAFAALRTTAGFRRLLQRHTRDSHTVIPLPGEPGTPLAVEGTVHGSDGAPATDVLVLAYQTDARGIYNPAGDEHDPRLFGFVRTAADGRFGFRTIRPAAYPGDEAVPQHIHVVIRGDDGAESRQTIGFADDPFWRERRRPDWAVPVTTDAAGGAACRIAFTVPWTVAPHAALAPRLRAELAPLLARGAPGASAAVRLPDGAIVTAVVGTDALDVDLTPAGVLLSGSIGKTYCAAIALQFVHEGKLALDGKVAGVLGPQPWFARVPNATTITLRHLLQHTSGIREHVWKPAFQAAVQAAGDRRIDPVESLGFALDDPPLAPAGERFAYADTNYLLAGLCIEAVAGKPYEDLLRERLLAPLALRETAANEGRVMAGLVSGRASGLAFHTGPTVQDGAYFTNPAFEYCGGGVRSTPRDLARWVHALFAGDAVPAPLRAAHTTPVAAPRHLLGGYGLGCFVGRTELGPTFGHSGFMPGFASQALWFAEPRLAVQVPGDDPKQSGNLAALCVRLAQAARER